MSCTPRGVLLRSSLAANGERHTGGNSGGYANVLLRSSLAANGERHAGSGRHR